MYCPAADGLYLKANGSFACWSSPGDAHPMLQVDARDLDGVDFIEDVLNGEVFRAMRRSLYGGEEPFDYCRWCTCIDPDRPDPWRYVDTRTFALRRIQTLLVEPSYLCNVDCPLCVRLHERKESQDPPHLLDPAVFRKLVDDLVRHRIEVDVCQFSGRGEPLLCSDLPEIVRYAKENLNAQTACDTNGNVPFRPEIMTCGLDWLLVAVDGVTQASYERYRRGGRLSRVLRLLRDCIEFKRRNDDCATRVAWKMILFEWNSSDAEIREAFRLAGEIGVDQLRFVQTDTAGGASFDDGGARICEVKRNIDAWAVDSPVPVLFCGFDPTPPPKPRARVKLSYEVPAGTETPRLDLTVWAFNETTEPLSVRARIRAVPAEGGAPLELDSLEFDIPERQDRVHPAGSIIAGTLTPGKHELRIDLEDAKTGGRLADFGTTVYVPG